MEEILPDPSMQRTGKKTLMAEDSSVWTRKCRLTFHRTYLLMCQRMAAPMKKYDSRKRYSSGAMTKSERKRNAEKKMRSERKRNAEKKMRSERMMSAGKTKSAMRMRTVRKRKKHEMLMRKRIGPMS
jgi:hypothetical protein